MAIQRKGPIDKAQAIAIARQTIAKASTHDHDMVIQEKKTEERDFGWVFFYTTRKFLETGDKKYLVPGNAPLVVEREDGSTHFLGTSLPPNRAIERFEQAWRERHGPR